MKQIWKTYGTWVLVLLLGAAVVLAAGHWNLAHRERPIPLCGTYSTPGQMTGTRYFTFPGDGDYYSYDQSGRLISQGNILQETRGVYRLTEVEGGASYLFLMEGRLYQEDGDALLTYELHTKQPVFINFDPQSGT